MTRAAPAASPPLVLLLAGALGAPVPAQTEWHRLPLLTHRAYPACAWDQVHNRLVLFGGEDGAGRCDDTWEFDGSEWQRVTPMHAPVARSEAAAAFDPIRGVVVLFGGRTASGEQADTWEWDGNDWTQRAPATTPAARRLHAMAWDGSHQRVLLFGGRDAAFLERDDTWEWDGVTWTPRQPLHRPGPRTGAGMTWDPTRGVVVLYGGSCFQLGPCWRADTWEWDGADWTEVTPPWPSPSPPPRWSHGMVFDTARSRAVVFGGSDDPGHYMDDTWEFDGSAWTERLPTHRPVGRLGHGMVYDAATQRALVVGGESWIGRCSDLWALETTDWRQAHAGMQPNSGPYPVADVTWDGGRDVLVWFGGGIGTSPRRQTWEWNGERWDLVLTGQGPTDFEQHALAWLPSRDRVILHQPAHAAIAEQTWQYDGASWTLVTTAALPGVRGGFALALDPGFDRLVLFGGVDPAGPRSATWLFDGLDWTPAAPATSPPARADHAMALDAARRRVVLFGGHDGNALLGDTWEWDGTTWLPRSPGVAPAARNGHRLAYDSGRRRTILQGGTTATGHADDTWEWDGQDWTLRTPPTRPPASYWQALAHDATRGATLSATALGHGVWSYGPTTPGAFSAFGSGCAGSLGAPVLLPELGQRPHVGVDFDLALFGLPGPLAFLMAGFSDTSWFGTLPLPFNLAPFGYPACELLVQTDVVVALPLANAQTRWTLPLPPAPQLIGVRFFTQALAMDPGGPHGLAMTPGGAGTIGSL